MTNLPRGWTRATIEDCASREPGAFTDGPYGSNLKTSHYTATGPRVIRLSNITAGALDMSDEAHIAVDHFKSLARHHVRPGDVVIAALGDPIGRACRVPDDIGPAMVKADCFRLRAGDHIDADYLVNWFNCVDARAVFLAASHGMGRIRVNLSDVRASPIPLAPLPEQRRIVAKLDRLSARSRAARDHLVRTAKLANRAKQAILAAAFDAALAGGECGIQDLLSEPIRNGLSIRGNDHPPGVPALRLSALREGTVNLGDVRFLQVTAERAAPYRLRTADVLVSRGNGNLRLLAIASIVPETDGSVIFPDTAFRIRISPSAGDPRWFAVMWSAPQVRLQIEGLAKTTAGIWKVSQADLRQVRLPRMAADAQREMADRIEAAFARIDRLTAEAARAAHLLDRLDERLLAKAFRGELVPQDPADEPAEAILARVRAARAEAPRPRRSRRARAS